MHEPQADEPTIEKRPIDEFEEDESVEYVESNDCALILRNLLIRLFISMVLISLCTAAVIFSFIEGEAGESHHEVHRDASKNFSCYVDEYTKSDGVYRVSVRSPDTDPVEQVYKSYWIQSNANQSIVHQISPNLTIYAFKDHAYWVEMKGELVTSCTYDRSMNYMQYIYNLGLSSLAMHHSEIEQTHHHQKVFIYQGNPHEVLHAEVNQTAFLVTAYADSESGALLGWDTYFSGENSDVVTLLAYEYDLMASAKPDLAWFQPPALCSPTAV